MIRAGARRAVERRGKIPPFRIKPPYKLGFAPRPGVPPANPLEGDDFVELVMKILLNGYQYDLQKLPIWPMEPGHRIPALHKSLLKKWEEEHRPRAST